MEVIIVICIIIVFVLYNTNFDGESKEELRNKIRYLEQKLNGDDFKKLLVQTSREIENRKKEAENEAREIRARGRKYVDSLTQRVTGELELKKLNLQNDINNFEIEKENLIKRNSFLEGLYSSFQESYISGRYWLVEQYIEVVAEKDFAEIEFFKNKKNPAIKASEKLAEIQLERRELLRKYKFLEYQLKTYEEYFPFLLDYQNEILNDEITRDTNYVKSGVDPVNRFLNPEEYSALSTTQKNQLALTRYIQGNLSNKDIGKMYERYLGYFYEKQGYDIQFIGIEKGVEDLGQDLICSKGNEVIVIQAKCWAKNREIRERHIFQLFSTTLLHKMENSNKKAKYTSILYTTAQLSPLARDIADKLKVKYVEYFSLDKGYPMIKCNVGKQGEKIYHLPFDQMYDKVKISGEDEFYAKTVEEAENKGFRRAFKFKGFSS
ncbi:restriction endonuclease [Actinobacillus porcitonsillarum]|nr:restriction endonuclease [Actinobacillus porcitonsillarum]